MPNVLHAAQKPLDRRPGAMKKAGDAWGMMWLNTFAGKPGGIWPTTSKGPASAGIHTMQAGGRQAKAPKKALASLNAAREKYAPKAAGTALGSAQPRRKYSSSVKRDGGHIAGRSDKLGAY